MVEASNTIGSGTVAGGLQYLDFLSAKGHVPPGAVAALKTAFSKVMKTLGGEDWGKILVREIDLDNYMARFANMTQGQYSAKSLMDYKSRVKKVITWYLEFLSKPGWAPDVKLRMRSTQKTAGQDLNREREKTEVPSILEVTPNANKSESIPPARTNLIAFPFPLTDGSLATFYLPPTISAPDASRMARFIGTLVVESGADDGRE